MSKDPFPLLNQARSAPSAKKKFTIATSSATPPPPPKKKPAPKPAKPRNVVNPRPPKYSRDDIKDLHAQGLSIAEIAAQVGSHRSTVTRALTDAGISPEQRPRGPKPRPFCGKGLHDMAIYGRPVPQGGRYCSECKKAGRPKK